MAIMKTTIHMIAASRNGADLGALPLHTACVIAVCLFCGVYLRLVIFFLPFFLCMFRGHPCNCFYCCTYE